MSNINQLIRPDLADFKPYVSARDHALKAGVFLNANESPWENHWQLTINHLNRYPSQHPDELMKRLANLYGVEPSELLVTHGSDEAIDLLIRLFCSPGRNRILITPPTFGMYEVAARINNISVVNIPLIASQNFSLDVETILKNYTDDIKILFLCSPNNPTGNLLSKAKLLMLCNTLKNRCVIVVDEAYIEFSHQQSLSSYIKNYDNLVILRTLSKAYGLAGLRCGFVLANTDIIHCLRRIVMPYSIATPVFSCLNEMLKKDYLLMVKERITMLIQERKRLLNALKTIKNIKKIWKSETNFILVKVDDIKQTLHRCEQAGIVLRDVRQQLNLENCIRITIGTTVQNDQLLEVLS